MVSIDDKSKMDLQTVIKHDELVELNAIDMTAPESEILPQIKEGISETGFFALKNVEGYDEESHYKAVKAFYDIPREELDKLLW